MKVQSLAKVLKVADKTVTKYRKNLQESGTSLKDLVATPWKRPSVTNLRKKRPVSTTFHQISANIAFMYHKQQFLHTQLSSTFVHSNYFKGGLAMIASVNNYFASVMHSSPNRDDLVHKHVRGEGNHKRASLQ